MSSKSFKAGLLGMVIAASAAANTGDVQDGKALFSHGKYEQALEKFERRLESGKATDATRYNIAVTLYRLGRYDEARDRFLALGELPKWKPLADYNLGLVAMAMKNRAAARQYFELAANQRRSTKIATLARDRLDALDESRQRKRASAAADSWTILFNTKAGYDSNALSLADDLVQGGETGEANFMELMGYAQTWLSGTRNDGVKFYVFGFGRQFEDFDSVDSDILGTSLSLERPWGNLDTETGIRLLHSRVASTTVADQLQLKAELSRTFDSSKVSIAYQPSYFFASDEYQQIDGWQHRIEVGWKKVLSPVTLKARYRFEVNDRTDRQRGAAFYSYSPTRNNIKGEVAWRFHRALTLALMMEYQHSDYDGENTLRDSDGEVRTATRVNRRRKIGAELEYRIAKPLKLSMTYEHIDADDTFALYEYDKSKIYGALEYRF